MENTNQIQLQQNLESIEKQFSIWRSTRGNNRKMPEELWNEAVKLAKVLPMHKVSKTLRLNYQKLKQAVNPNFKVTKRTNKKQNFVEVSIDSSNTLSTLVEIESKDGAKMKIHPQTMKNNMDLINQFLDSTSR